ncbi:MAG TPA: ABC transporter ATP-binding protein [Acidobacteriaceae bacterium]|nr:ABC transporter ATP-binding protein [Acidobacteriaceae bacterium]
MPAIAARLENVSRLFGRFPALRQISVSFEVGRCYVLLGENGAGKSTLLRVIAGLLEPTLGAARIFSGEPGVEGGRFEVDRESRSTIGYMSHAPMLYDELSGVENLRYFAGLYRTCRCLAPEEALRMVGLDPALDRPVGQYSQGMRQRASLARVLLPQPELMLLDEPFSNMDAASVRQMMTLIESLRESGRTILLTTHQRELAAPLADYFVVMEAGRLVSVTAGPALASARDLWAEAKRV